jgi:ABC-type lipoprotein release transport system permease subunit
LEQALPEAAALPLGARQVDIRNQFVMEAFTVTVTGGLLGIAMGLAIAKGVAAYAGWKTMRAARLDPVEALRNE